MKRFSAIAAIALYLLVFSGCSNEGAARKAAVADFSADAVITYGGETEKAFLTSDLKGISLLIGSGNLKDVKYSCDGKSTEIFCDGVTVKNSTEGLSSSLPCAIFNSINTLRKNENLTVKSSDDKRTVYQSKNASGSFTAAICNESGFIEEIEYSDINFCAKLTGIKEYK